METGHAKNIANANLLNTYIAQLGALYNPSNAKLSLDNLQNKYTIAYSNQEAVNNATAPYSLAVDNRELIFEPFNKKITKLGKVLKVTDGITQAQLDDFMTISRKLKGTRKTQKITDTNTLEEQNYHSTAQLSYDQRTNNFDLLISLFQNIPNYAPNETEYQIATLLEERVQMLKATQFVVDAFVPLNNARNIRNNTMYTSQDNLVDTFNKAKDYLFTILDSKSVQYKAIAKINFKKIGV